MDAGYKAALTPCILEWEGSVKTSSARIYSERQRNLAVVSVIDMVAANPNEVTKFCPSTRYLLESGGSLLLKHRMMKKLTLPAGEKKQR
jgi:hypothetical protein